VAASADLSCALVGDHDIRCWGYNQLGELGDGSYTNSATPVSVVWDPPEQ
jgi:hypothetical protein